MKNSVPLLACILFGVEIHLCSLATASTIADTLAQIPANSWAKLNVNEFREVWTPPAQRPTGSSPESNISAWSGAAWDSLRKRLMVWGGNIGDEQGNEFYIFDTEAGLWSRGALPSQIKADNGFTTTVDGVHHSPISGESWDNIVYLEVADRVAVMGISRGGANWFDPFDGQPAGPYFFDPITADPYMVSGLSGSQVSPQTFPNVIGGEMWENRDNTPTSLRSGKHGVTAYINGGDKDIVLFSTRYDHLYRYTIFDVDEPAHDRWEYIGRRPLSGRDGYGSGDYDPTRNIFVKTLPSSFSYWDIGAAGSANRAIEFSPRNLSGVPLEQPVFFHGMAYDPILDGFMLWSGGDTIWFLKPPGTLGPAGWTLEQITPSGNGPQIVGRYTGVFGKWVYLAQEGAYLGVIDSSRGDVFVYKPDYPDNAGDSENSPPTSGFSFGCLGLNCSFQNNAGDTDGRIVGWQWDFGDGQQSNAENPSHIYADGNNYSVTLVVTDDGGATAVVTKSVLATQSAMPSAPIDVGTFTIQSFENQDRSGTATVKDGGATLELAGNTWKRIDFPYKVSSNTVLEFDFYSDRRGEVHGIGLEEDNRLSSNRIFQLYGLQKWGIQNYNDYSAQGWKHYLITVGDHYRGDMNYLVFAMDDDARAQGTSRFRNIIVHEGSAENTPPELTSAQDVQLEATAVFTPVSLTPPTVSEGAELTNDAPPDGFPLGTSTVTWRATAPSGAINTATQRITIVDTTPPVLTPPADVDPLEQDQDIGTASASDIFPVTITNNAPTYFPAGQTTVTWTATDASGNRSTALQRINVIQSAAPADSIQFDRYVLRSFENQDRRGSAVVEGDGTTLTLVGNTWKRIDFPYTLTSRTVIEFDFYSAAKGEIHGIGFGEANRLNQSRIFQLYGTQKWGIQDYHSYTESGWEHLRIPVGQFYRGNMAYLVFAMDDDGKSRGESRFRNLRVTEQ